MVGLTSFRSFDTTGLGSASSPCALGVRAFQSISGMSRACLLAQVCNLLPPVTSHDVYQQFTCVNHTSQPSLRTVEAAVSLDALASTLAAPCGAFGTLFPGLHTPPLPATHARVGYLSRKKGFSYQGFLCGESGLNNQDSDFPSRTPLDPCRQTA